MTQSLKELAVVLVIASAVFYFARSIAVKFIPTDDFRRRRNVWLALTVAGFVFANFWWFALVAVPVLYWAGKRDSSPAAFYLFTYLVVPAVPVDLPSVIPGVNALFPLDICRLLSLFVLLPASVRLMRVKRNSFGRRITILDVLLVSFGVLQVLLRTPYGSFTNALRELILFFLDAYLLYYVVSRSCTSERIMKDVLASLCLIGFVLAAIGAFETARNWYLYADIAQKWAPLQANRFYTFRGGFLRAQVSTGGPVLLGYVLAISVSFWLYLRTFIHSQRLKYFVACLLWLGFLAAYSRGPWLGAVVIYYTYAILNPKPLRELTKAISWGLLVAAVFLLTPLGDRVASVLPMMGGTVDSGNILYRQRLAARSWDLIMQSPWLGDQLAFSKMEDLRQGMGIIDLVNTYAEVALYNGFVGLAIFLAFILIAGARALRASRISSATDSSYALLGSSLVAALFGSLIMLATCSFTLSSQILFYVIAGLSSAYAARAVQSLSKPRATGLLQRSRELK
jgi:hypothetical protein